VLSQADEELVAAARAVLAAHHRPFWHTVAAALRGRDGRIVTGIHFGTTVGSMATCAEAVAIGRALLEGVDEVETIVAVRQPKPDEPPGPPSIVPPCGRCRELLLDHHPTARVIVAPDQVVPIAQLLPMPYRR
jgi:cytidine deaminase